MGRNYRLDPTVYAATITANTGAPTASTDGVAYPNVSVTECMVLVSGNGLNVGASVLVTPYWYDKSAVAGAGKWVEGAGTTVTNSGVIAVYCVGTRLYLRFNAVTLSSGSFEVSTQFMAKAV